MKGIALSSILAISIVAPAFGAVGDKTINAGASNVPCTSATLDTPTGPAALEADWTANTIKINWDAKNGTTIPQTQCVYDDTLNLPTTPTKTGYTFGGWTVKVVSGGGQSGPAQCSLSGLDPSIDGIAHLSKNFAGDYCEYYNSDIDEAIDDCSDNTFSGLSTGEWQTNFSYGSVKGTAYCSAKSGNAHKLDWGGNSSDWSATESELTSASGEAKYCWCKVTEYTPDGGEMCVSASESWVFLHDNGSPSGCASGCVNSCGSEAHSRDSFRAALFGQ